MVTRKNPRAVFVNCPFDAEYKKIFDAIVFTVHDLGFQARHALIDNTVPERLDRIATEIFNATYSIHDISRIKPSGPLKLPRFNMPFEAGMAYAVQKNSPIGTRHFLLLDSVRYQYQASMSDVAGLDPKAHENQPHLAIRAVRNFLVTKSGLQGLPGPAHIVNRHALFLAKLPKMVRMTNMTMGEIKSWECVNDLQYVMAQWIESNPP